MIKCVRIQNNLSLKQVIKIELKKQWTRNVKKYILRRKEMIRNMKIQKMIATGVLSISMLFGILMIHTEAVNQTSNTNQSTSVQNGTGQNTSNQNTTSKKVTNSNVASQNTNQTTNATTVEKSSNANLSNLGIKPHDFKGFRSGTTSYQVAVPQNTTTIEVYATTQDKKATLVGTGKKNLEMGENQFDVQVTAEDGTKKTYTLHIDRGGEDSADSAETGNGLAELKINNLSLSPAFHTNVYEYTVKYIGEDTRLNIETKPTDENYTIEVIGNENLQEGENIITILVSDKNGDNIATYQVTVNKSLVDEEAIAREQAEAKAKQQKMIIGIVVAVAILGIIVFMLIRRKRNQQLAEDFSGISFYHRKDSDDYEEEEDDDTLPKALKQTKIEKKEQDEKDVNQEEAQEEEEIENMPKEELKEKFLNNYSNYEEDYEEDENSKRKGKRKGKRFK